MKPFFALDATGHLVSAIEEANQALSCITVGTCFEFEKPYSTPWGDVPVGTVAVVTEVHNVTGELDLEVTEKIPALFYWGQLLIMLPFMSDDLATCLHLLS